MRIGRPVVRFGSVALHFTFMSMIHSYPRSYSSGPRHLEGDDAPPSLITPYSSAAGTPEDEEEMALLQRLEQMQAEAARGAPPESPQDDVPEGTPPEPDADRMEDEPSAVDGHAPADVELPAASEGAWPGWDPGRSEWSGGSSLSDPTRPRDERLAPVDRATWFNQRTQSALGKAQSMRDPVFPADANDTQRAKGTVSLSPAETRGGDATGTRSPKRRSPVATSFNQQAPAEPMPGPAVPAGPAQALPPQSPQTGVDGDHQGSRYKARLQEVGEGKHKHYQLKIDPPKTDHDVMRLLEEEVRSSPTSAEYVSHLKKLCADENCDLEWKVSPDANADKAGFKLTFDEKTGRHKAVISVSQQGINGGTFGHEADHVIKALKYQVGLSKQKAAGGGVTGPFLDGLTASSQNPVFTNSLPDRDRLRRADSGEYEAMRAGNTIIAERILNGLADADGITYAQRLEKFTPQLRDSDQTLQRNTVTWQSNVGREMDSDTKFGDGKFKRLRDDWKRLAVEEETATRRRQERP